MVRPGGLELPTFWFVARHSQNLNGLFGVAYEPKHITLTPTMRPRDLSSRPMWTPPISGLIRSHYGAALPEILDETS
jgi:hypothetical protein